MVGRAVMLLMIVLAAMHLCYYYYRCGPLIQQLEVKFLFAFTKLSCPT